jgi:hypothetical protein
MRAIRPVRGKFSFSLIRFVFFLTAPIAIYSAGPGTSVNATGGAATKDGDSGDVVSSDDDEDDPDIAAYVSFHFVIFPFPPGNRLTSGPFSTPKHEGGANAIPTTIPAWGTCRREAATHLRSAACTSAQPKPSCCGDFPWEAYAGVWKEVTMYSFLARCGV